MKEKLLLSLLLGITGVMCSQALEIKKIREIPIQQDEVILERVVDLAVTEDQYFLFPDMKAGNIKIFDKQGKLVKVWGRKGFGPGEFVKPSVCDYKAPHFLVMDRKRRSLMLFKRTKPLEFEKILERQTLKFGMDIILRGTDSVLIAGYKENPQREKFGLYKLNLRDGNVRYILPVHKGFGLNSQKEFERRYQNEIVPVGYHGFCDLHGGNIYYVWQASLTIIKISPDKKLSRFGHRSDQYHLPVSTPAMQQYQKERSRKVLDERKQFSYVGGLIAAKRFVGLLYANYKPELHAWQYILQLYKPDGSFFAEKVLKEAIFSSDSSIPSFCYDKRKNTLYFLSRFLTPQNEDVYKIIVFKIAA